MDNQETIDKKNCEYWDTLCGTGLAKSLGIFDLSEPSLARFDTYYLDFYPYLLTYVPIEALRNRKVLEVGLGYGTLSQVLMQATDYSGLDIAQGPVDVVNVRAGFLGRPPTAVQGSVLQPPFEPESFDAVVSIGCLHHTGNLQEALRQLNKLLKPSGELYFMIYSAYSYRRWLSYPLPTLKQFLSEFFGIGKTHAASAHERSAYDQNAPETAFTSTREVKRMLKQAGFDTVYVTKENASPEGIFLALSRTWMLRWMAPYCGLDLYIKAVKRA